MKGDRSWLPGAVDLDWIESVAAPVDPALRAIEEAAAPLGVPIVDRHTGRVLSALAGDRRRIVEVGTAFGYSTLWLALGQPSGGRIVTIDPDTGRTDRARDWWRSAGIPDERIVQVSRPALDAFGASDPALAGPFDLAFIDAIKHEYAGYLAALTQVGRLAPGALVVADNVLWSGRVAASGSVAASASAVAADRSTDALRAFCEAVAADARFTTTILPVGDGLLVATWRGPAGEA